METQGLLEQLKDGVQAFRSGARWQEFLDTAARFHHYSFRNQVLIWAQYPEATHVAGYQTWRNEFGQQVKKGEHGIAILAPMIAKRTERDANGEERTREALIGFRPVHVFDLAQTEAQDTEQARATRATLETPVVAELAGDAGAYLLARLERVAHDAGLALSREDTGRANGYAMAGGSIVLSTANSPSQDAKTLAHEIAHHWLGHIERPEEMAKIAAGAGIDAHHLAEFEAESAAYLVSKALGLNADGYSFGYLAVWTAGLDRDALDALFVHCGGRVQGVAQRMIAATEHVGLEGAA
jgi:antirestriction protein ArdC